MQQAVNGWMPRCGVIELFEGRWRARTFESDLHAIVKLVDDQAHRSLPARMRGCGKDLAAGVQDLMREGLGVFFRDAGPARRVRNDQGNCLEQARIVVKDAVDADAVSAHRFR